jgi:ribosomal protein L29
MPTQRVVDELRAEIAELEKELKAERDQLAEKLAKKDARIDRISRHLAQANTNLENREKEVARLTAREKQVMGNAAVTTWQGFLNYLQKLVAERDRFEGQYKLACKEVAAYVGAIHSLSTLLKVDWDIPDLLQPTVDAIEACVADRDQLQGKIDEIRACLEEPPVMVDVDGYSLIHARDIEEIVDRVTDGTVKCKHEKGLAEIRQYIENEYFIDADDPFEDLINIVDRATRKDNKEASEQ